MTILNSPDYYRRRLLQSEERAALASTPEVRAIHHELAQRYAELLQTAEGPRDRPTLKLILPSR